GVAFLTTNDPVVDGDRAPGTKPVEWMQVKLLVELLNGVTSIGTYSWELSAADGTTLAKSGRELPGSSTAQWDLADQRLRSYLYPTKVPELREKAWGQVLILGVSGDIRQTNEVKLKIT